MYEVSIVMFGVIGWGVYSLPKYFIHGINLQWTRAINDAETILCSASLVCICNVHCCAACNAWMEMSVDEWISGYPIVVSDLVRYAVTLLWETLFPIQLTLIQCNINAHSMHTDTVQLQWMAECMLVIHWWYCTVAYPSLINPQVYRTLRLSLKYVFSIQTVHWS